MIKRVSIFAVLVLSLATYAVSSAKTSAKVHHPVAVAVTDGDPDVAVHVTDGDPDVTVHVTAGDPDVVQH